MSGTIRDVAAGIFPQTYRRIQAALMRYRLKRVNRFLARKHGLVVMSGPFQGMRYLPETVWGSLTPQLLGSYEIELHEALTQIIATDYETIVDIGCAEGFYAVGLALRLPNARIFAVDIDQRSRQLCHALAVANEVADRVLVAGECDHGGLQMLTNGRVLIICDCEGCELGLLDPALVPGLKTSDLLIELHDLVDANITPTLITRFAPSHDITLIDTTERDPDLFPELKGFSRATQRTAVAEFRDAQMQWAWMRAKAVVTQSLQSDS